MEREMEMEREGEKRRNREKEREGGRDRAGKVEAGIEDEDSVCRAIVTKRARIQHKVEYEFSCGCGVRKLRTSHLNKKQERNWICLLAITNNCHACTYHLDSVHHVTGAAPLPANMDDCNKKKFLIQPYRHLSVYTEMFKLAMQQHGRGFRYLVRD
jgi:hypothetical protein